MLDWYFPWQYVDWLVRLQMLIWLMAIVFSFWVFWRTLIKKRAWLQKKIDDR